MEYFKGNKCRKEKVGWGCLNNSLIWVCQSVTCWFKVNLFCQLKVQSKLQFWVKTSKLFLHHKSGWDNFIHALSCFRSSIALLVFSAKLNWFLLHSRIVGTEIHSEKYQSAPFEWKTQFSCRVFFTIFSLAFTKQIGNLIKINNQGNRRRRCAHTRLKSMANEQLL